MNNNIIETLTRIEAKLDAVIKALHEYDDANIEDINEGYGESSFESFMDSKDDILHWKVDGAERRTHYVTNEEADEDANNNTQGKDKDKHVGGDKKRTAKDRRKYYKPKQTK